MSEFFKRKPARPKKFRIGRQVFTPGEILCHIEKGSWFYLYPGLDKPLHPSWVGNQQFWRLCNLAAQGKVFLAVRNAEF